MMKTWKLLLILSLALATTKLVNSEPETSDLLDRDLERINYDVVRDAGIDDAEAEAEIDQLVADAARKVYEAFTDGASKRSALLHMRKRFRLKNALKSLGRKIWRKIKAGGRKLWKKIKKNLRKHGIKWVIRWLLLLLGRGKRSDLEEFSEFKRDDLWAMAKMRRQDGDEDSSNGCQNLEIGDLADAMGTLSTVTDIVASEEGCGEDAGEDSTG